MPCPRVSWAWHSLHGRNSGRRMHYWRERQPEMKTRLVLTLSLAIGMAGMAAEPTWAVTGLSAQARISCFSEGCRLQTVSEPNYDGTVFDPVLWAQSYFTTIHVGVSYPVAQMPAAPGPAWGITDYTYPSNLPTASLPYASSMISIQYNDEQALTADEDARLAPLMASFHANQPNVITYTNQGDPVENSGYSPAVMQNYMKTVQPDMLCFDDYAFQGNLVGGSPTRLYSNLEYYREFGLAGNDGTGAQPIPVGIYTQEFVSVNNHTVSESEIRLNTFAAWAFGCKFVDRFTYETCNSAITGIMFSGSGTANPTPQFYQVAETNRQSLNLGPALVRLVSTDARMVMGQNQQGSSNVPNVLPDGVSSWDPSAGTTEKYITSITATNLGRKAVCGCDL